MTESKYDFQDLRVLVVDDNRSMRHIIRSILNALGCREIRESADAPAAFKEMQGFDADIILVDWLMEPLDGLEFVRLVRTAKDSRNPFVPIVMLSGFTEYRRIAEARDAGVNEFLAKPVSVTALGNRIVSLIEKPREFVRTKTFFGPCRRRTAMGPPRGIKERRKDGMTAENTSSSTNA